LPKSGRRYAYPHLVYQFACKVSSNLSTIVPVVLLAEWGRRGVKKRNIVQLPKNRLVGYARVSTAEQNLDMQIDALKAAGVLDDNLHVEKVSSVAARRPKLELALMDARDGDTFIVTKLDRLGRNVVDLYTKVETMQKRGVTFRSLNDHIDTSTAVGKLVFGVLACMAQFERDQTVERTKSGLAAARRRGYVPGAKRRVNVEHAREMLKAGKTVAEVAKRYKVSSNAVRRYFTSAELEAFRATED